MSNIIIFLPGWARTEFSYKRLVHSRSAGTRVEIIKYEQLIPDGQTDNFNNNLRDYLKSREIDNFTLAGHSVGGALAINFTQQYPGMVEKLILVDSTGIPSDQSIFLFAFNVIKNALFFGHKKILENLVSIWWMISKAKLNFNLGLYAYNADIRSAAKLIKTQTILLWAQDDVLESLEQGRQLQSLISRAELVVLKNMDHDWILHSPQAFWANIFK